MGRRLTALLLPPLAAATLVAVPISVSAPAAAAGIGAAVIEPDRTQPFDYDVMSASALDSKYEGFPVHCVAVRDVSTPYVIPEIDAAFSMPDERAYRYLEVYLAGPGGEAGDLGEEAQVATVIEHYDAPSAGDSVVHQDGVNADAVLCITWPESQTTPSTDQPSVTGPVVETDRVADSGSAARLGLAAAATALVTAAGAVFVGRRRQGVHR